METYEKNGKLYYKFNVLRNSRLRSSIIQNKIQDIGKIRPIEREVNLNADRKRLWFSQLESLKEKKFCDSVPIPIDLVGDIISKKEVTWKGYDESGYVPESEL